MTDWTDRGDLARAVARTESRAEALLLVALWGERAGWTIATQLQVGPYRIDIAIPEARLAIEVEGAAFHGGPQLEADAARQNALVAVGWTVLRYPARIVFLSAGRCAGEIAQRARSRARIGSGAQQPQAPRRLAAPDRATTVAGAQMLRKALGITEPRRVER